jgi:FAD synthetase
MMRTVLASGVFDRLHNGHVFYLEEARKLGDRLVVCVASDATAKKSGKNPLLDERQRAELVASLKFVDRAFVGKDLGGEWTIYDTIREEKADVVALGFDQKFDEDEISSKCKTMGMEVEVARIGKLPGVRKMKDGKISES